MLIVNQKPQTEQQEAELARIKAENNKLKAIIEYIGAMDYPEIFESAEEESSDELL